MSPSTTTTYTVTVTDGCGSAAATDVVTITVNPIPQINFTVDEDSGCVPLSVTFTEAAIPGGTTCTWDFGDGNTATGCGNMNHTYTTPGCHDVTLTVESGGCTNSLTQPGMVCVFENAVADFAHTPEIANVYDPVYSFTNLSSGADSYLWTFDTLGTSTDEHPTFNFGAISGGYLVCLTATNAQGCNSVYCDSVYVEETFTVFAPNAFTPTGDGINDSFMPIIRGEITDTYGVPCLQPLGTAHL